MPFGGGASYLPPEHPGLFRVANRFSVAQNRATVGRSFEYSQGPEAYVCADRARMLTVVLQGGYLCDAPIANATQPAMNARPPNGVTAPNARGAPSARA